MPQKKPKPDVRLTDMKERAVLRIAELWDVHIEKAMKILDESESRVVRLNFGVQLDFAESTAKETTSIRYTQAYTDERQDDFETTVQGALVGRAPDGSIVAQITPPRKSDTDDGEGTGEETGEGTPPETGKAESVDEGTPPTSAESSEASAAIARAKNRVRNRKQK